ncbi:MAG: hypothetical protein N3G20_01370, partial [Verrucomicrobiae bacterium]|nr:hypothetical protein [Verrucomicrobiae bacterium]
MDWLLPIDTALFKLINQGLANPVFDHLMPIASGSPLFVPVLVVAVVLLWLLGGTRGRLCVVMFVVVVLMLDNAIVDILKRALERSRPFLTLPDTRLLVGRGASYSMPSGHVAAWFGA